MPRLFSDNQTPPLERWRPAWQGMWSTWQHRQHVVRRAKVHVVPHPTIDVDVIDFSKSWPLQIPESTATPSALLEVANRAETEELFVKLPVAH
jgi:hypothetical protein